MRASQHSGYCHAGGHEHHEFIQQRAVEGSIALQKPRRRVQQPELLHAQPELVDELLALALRADQIGDVPVDADHAHRPAVRVADGLPHAANGADRAVRSPDPEVGPVLAVAAERGLDVARGARAGLPARGTGTTRRRRR